MSTYLGWTVVVMPSTPAAPASFEYSANDASAMSISPFTGQQQVQRWGALPHQLTASFPPIPHANVSAWITFMEALNGVANVTQFSSAFGAAYPEIGGRYWRLKSGSRKWSVSSMRVYGITLDLIEAM